MQQDILAGRRLAQHDCPWPTVPPPCERATLTPSGTLGSVLCVSLRTMNRTCRSLGLLGGLCASYEECHTMLLLSLLCIVVQQDGSGKGRSLRTGLTGFLFPPLRQVPNGGGQVGGYNYIIILLTLASTSLLRIVRT